MSFNLLAAGTPMSRIGFPTVTRTYALIATGLALVAALGIGGALIARSQIEARDAAIAAQQEQISDLTHAVLAFQTELSSVQDDRDRLVLELDTRTRERDQVQVERDGLSASLAETQRRANDTQISLSEANKQLNQAREEGASQQKRASNADTRATAIAAVLKLDDQIHAEYLIFFQQVQAMTQANQRRDYVGASSASSRAQTSSDRLKSLFDQRQAALRPI